MPHTDCDNSTSFGLFLTVLLPVLQEDFDIFFTPANYEDPEIQKQIREHHIAAHERTRGHRPSTTVSTEAGLRRLGRLLQHSEQELWSDLALRALGTGDVQKALPILR